MDDINLRLIKLAQGLKLDLFEHLNMSERDRFDSLINWLKISPTAPAPAVVVESNNPCDCCDAVYCNSHIVSKKHGEEACKRDPLCPYKYFHGKRLSAPAPAPAVVKVQEMDLGKTKEAICRAIKNTGGEYTDLMGEAVLWVFKEYVLAHEPAPAPEPKPCPACGGKGDVPGELGYHVCLACHGTGRRSEG
jgi:hypothetical protein